MFQLPGFYQFSFFESKTGRKTKQFQLNCDRCHFHESHIMKSNCGEWSHETKHAVRVIFSRHQVENHSPWVPPSGSWNIHPKRSTRNLRIGAPWKRIIIPSHHLQVQAVKSSGVYWNSDSIIFQLLDGLVNRPQHVRVMHGKLQG